MTRYVPVMGDRDTGGFFEAAQQGKLVFRACLTCQAALHPPVAHCRHCGSWETEWREASGAGTLYAWTTVTHQVHPDYPTPYTLVLVDLEDTSPVVRLVGSLDGAPELTTGMRMRVWFEEVSGCKLPQWRAEILY
jgi:uncharacterized OB-fold protein